MPVPAAALAAYRARLADLAAHPDAGHEGAVRGAFAALLQAAAGATWTLIEEHTTKGSAGKTIRYDGLVRDSFGVTLGHWEAKDTGDDLEREVQAKIARGYSLQNILFQAPGRALLYQDGTLRLDADLAEAGQLADLLDAFFSYREPEIERFHDAVAAFKERIPTLAKGLLDKIEAARAGDPAFRTRFEAFVETVRESVNPNVAVEAVEEMLVQHLLTERVIRSVFNLPSFSRRNAIAREIEDVIDTLTGAYFSREDFLGQLDRFYIAIEEAANGIRDFGEKQALLNTVYEQFFQGFSDRVADTHGIVYTPQPLVDWMVRSVDVLLARHFGQTLAAPGVHVLDPFVGTGNFLVRVMDQIPAPDLPAKYGAQTRGELHANEVMLLPYYVASLNVEHAYLEKTGSYRPFEGIVLVDTFEMVEGKTIGMFSAENSERAQRQREAPITVVIGNPPYNAHQVNANDANQNRKYPIVDGRVSETYAAASKAQNKNALADPYVKAFRWASDRIGHKGVVALVTNNSFVDDLSFDGMRHHLARDFSKLYVLDLKGNIRKDSMRDGIPLGEKNTVFGLSAMVGISVTLLVRDPDHEGDAEILYHAADWRSTRAEKFDLMERTGDVSGIDWRRLEPNKRHVWLTDDLTDDWDELLPLCSGDERRSSEANETTISNEYCRGTETGRDVWVYGFDRQRLAERVEGFVDVYNASVVKWQRKGGPGIRVEDVVTHDDDKIKWNRSLKNDLKRGAFADYDEANIRRAMYRPFVTKHLYFDSTLVYLPGSWDEYFPTPDAENLVISVTDKASEKPFMALMTDRIADLHIVGAGASAQCIPFSVYRRLGDGAEVAKGETEVELSGARYARRDNLTDWALGQFQEQYADAGIAKADVFHYVYAVLHHPAYRARYAADLKRSLPRVPFAPTFHDLAEAGRRLAALHVGYETADEYPLTVEHAPGTPLTYRVEKMKLDEDAGTLRLNDSLTLAGIPPEAARYRLGNRSALAWLADQLRVKTDARSGIVHDPNAAFEGDEIAALVKRVTTVSVETVAIVEALPDLGLPEA